MLIYCLGAGAIGGYFGGRLVEGGADVTFVVREERKKQLGKQGLKIESELGDFSSSVMAVTADEVGANADIILLACKAYDLASAVETIQRFAAPETAILPLLNGLSHMEVLNREFGAERVLGGFAKIAVTLSPDGVIRHLNKWNYITFGEQDGAKSERVRELAKSFAQTSVYASVSNNVLHGMWEKLVHLATVAGMTCLMRASVGEIARTPDGSRLAIDFLELNARIAAAEGYAPSSEFMDEYRRLLGETGSSYTSSMLRDIERKGPIESEHIIGYLIEKARSHGIDGTLHRIIYTHLKAYEERRVANRL